MIELKHSEEIISQLNDLRDKTDADINETVSLINTMIAIYRPVIKTINLEHITTKAIEEFRENKTAALNNSKFEIAEAFERLENDYLEYHSLMQIVNLNKSIFIYDNTHFIFLNLGTSEYDFEISEYLEMIRAGHEFKLLKEDSR